MPFTIDDLPATWVAKVNKMTPDELKREERRLVLGARRGFKLRRAGYVRNQTKPDNLAKWATRGSSYEDNYRRNTDKNGHEFEHRQGLVRKLMAKVWYLNYLKSVPDLDPFAEFRKAFAEVLTEAFGEELDEAVKVRKAFTNSSVYVESDSFKIELPLYEARLRKQRQQLSRGSRRVR
jgi:hypothetical protein